MTDGSQGGISVVVEEAVIVTSPVLSRKVTPPRLHRSGWCGSVMPLLRETDLGPITPVDSETKRRRELDRLLSQKPLPVSWQRTRQSPGSVRWEWEVDDRGEKEEPVLYRAKYMTVMPHSEYSERLAKAARLMAHYKRQFDQFNEFLPNPTCNSDQQNTEKFKGKRNLDCENEELVVQQNKEELPVENDHFPEYVTSDGSVSINISPPLLPSSEKRAKSLEKRHRPLRLSCIQMKTVLVRGRRGSYDVRDKKPK